MSTVGIIIIIVLVLLTILIGVLDSKSKNDFKNNYRIIESNKDGMVRYIVQLRYISAFGDLLWENVMVFNTLEDANKYIDESYDKIK